MKKKLILIQPQKYNELFSTYHSFKKSKKFLPKIPISLQKYWEITSYTTRTSNFNNKLNFSSNMNSYIYKRNNNFFNPTFTNQFSLESKNNDFLPFPSLTQQYKKTEQNFKNKKKYEIKKNNCKMIYLNLSTKNNRLIKNNSFEPSNKNIYINGKINDEKNNQKPNIKNIINEDQKSNIKNEITMIKNIPIVLVNSFAKDIYNSIYNKNNIKSENNDSKSKINENSNTSNNTSNINSINKSIYKNNSFFQYILNNVKHKIELINESNKSLSIINVMNLINSEITDLKKNLEDYEKNNAVENSKFTSNNVSKISNYEITTSNTFRFKTNNSNIKDNENNNNISTLGNLIKSNIYSKIYNGSKKLNFENNYLFNNVGKKSIFQNQEIIYSINQNETKGKSNYKNIKKINIKKNKKYSIDKAINTDYFTSNSYDFNFYKIQSQINFFNNNNIEKPITRSFSEIFLKKNYPKESDFINDISNKIEKSFLIKNDSKISEKKQNIKSKNISKNEKIKNKKSKKEQYKSKGQLYHSQYKNNNIKKAQDDYGLNKEENIITPKRKKDSIEAFSDHQEKKIKFKDEKIKNNYENIILNIDTIKNNELKTSLTPNKSDLKEKNLKTEQSKTVIDNSSENNEPNVIYFDKNKKRELDIKNFKDIKDIKDMQAIYEDISKDKKKNKKKKKKKNRNQDLTSIKTMKLSDKSKNNKTSNKNIFKNDINSVDNDDINENKKSKKNKRKKIKNEMIKNLIINDPNINDKEKEELIKQYIINSENEIDEEEEEDEEYDEEDEEYEEEEDEIKEKIDINVNNNNTNISKKKKKNRNKDNISKTENNLTDKRSKDNKIPKKKSHYVSEKKSKIISEPKLEQKGKKYDEVDSNSDEESFAFTNNKKKDFNQIKNKSKKNIEIIEDPDVIKEMKKYHLTNKNDLYNMKNLTLEKKSKNKGEGLVVKESDNIFFNLDENIDEIIKKNTPSGNLSKNFNKQEELKILNEVVELDNLTKEEKNFVLSEMLDLRNKIIKAKIINKDIRNQINLKRISVYKLVNKYFINLILNDIENKKVTYDKYVNKLKKLEKIQNFGIFTFKNLSLLEEKYITPYLAEEKKRNKELSEKEKKIRKRMALIEYEEIKKKLEKKNQKNKLIFDNLYLFKKEKNKEIKLRKEVEEILNSPKVPIDTNKRRETPRFMSLITRRKKNIIKKEKKSKKRNNFNLKKINFFEQDDTSNKDEEKLKELELQKQEEIKELNLKEFFKRIQKLKTLEFQDFDNELNQMMNEIIDKKDVISKKKETRINSFIQDFQLSRLKNKTSSKFNSKGFSYISPIRFISEHNN